MFMNANIVIIIIKSKYFYPFYKDDQNVKKRYFWKSVTKQTVYNGN